MPSFTKLFLRVALTIALCLAANQFLTAQTLTFAVTKSADTNDGVCDSDCSLREAIDAANQQGTVAQIAVNIPTTDAGCVNNACTIALTGGELLIGSAQNVTINNITPVPLRVSGNNRSRVFFIGNAARLTLNNLTVSGGVGTGLNNPNLDNTGGAILVNAGALTVNNSIISNNRAGTTTGAGGAIANNGGEVTLNNSTITRNTAADLGGGIEQNGGSLSVNNSTISFNATANLDGGGIDSFGNTTITIFNSTLNGNTAAGLGGGIFNDSGVLNLYNSTVSGNSAAGLATSGGIDSSGTLKLINVTIAYNRASSSDPGNGGGLWNGGTTSLRNTLIAGNSVGNPTTAAPDVRFDQGTFTSLGNNLISNTSNTNLPIAWNTAPATLDLLNQSPQLLLLDNNGGPTQTHLLFAGSPAADRGNNCILTANGCGDNNPALTTDQRGVGFPRLIGNTVDIGATEGVTSVSAAAVTVSGRVMNSKGRGLPDVTVMMTNQDGFTRRTTTDRRGRYQFDDVAAGGVYVFRAAFKRLRFEQSVQVRTVNEDSTTVNFVAVP